MLTTTSLGASASYDAWAKEFLAKTGEVPEPLDTTKVLPWVPTTPPPEITEWFSEYKWWVIGGVATLGLLMGVGGARGTQAASRGARRAGSRRVGTVLPTLLLIGGGLFLVGNITGGIGTAKFLSGLEGGLR